MQLTIATGFNFSPLNRAIRLANALVADSNGLATFTLRENESELLANYFKSLGNAQYRGRLTLNTFAFTLSSSVQGQSVSSSVYTLARIDGLPAVPSASQDGRYAGSALNVVASISSGEVHWMRYAPLKDNTTIVQAMHERTHLVWPDPNLFNNVGKSHIVYGFSQRNMRLGLSAHDTFGWISTLQVDNLFFNITGSTPGTRYFLMRKPFTDQEVPVRAHGTGYGVKFNAILADKGLGYGADVGAITNNGTNYPNDETLVADGNKCDVNGGACTTTGGGGVGLTVKFTAVAGVIATIDIVDSGEGYIPGDVITLKGNTDQIGNGDTLLDATNYKVNAAGVGENFSGFGGPASAILGEEFLSTSGGVIGFGAADMLEDLDSAGTPATFLFVDETTSQIEAGSILNSGSGALPSNENFEVLRTVRVVSTKTGVHAIGSNLVSIRVKTDGAGLVTDWRLEAQPTFMEDGDVVEMINDPTTKLELDRWYRGYETTNVVGSGTGLQVDIRKNDNGEVVDVRTSAQGIGYDVGNQVTVDGGNNLATLDVTESISNIGVAGGSGAGMKVDIVVADAQNIGSWVDDPDLDPELGGGVREIFISDIGDGQYKSGDVLTIPIGNNDCKFGLFFMPEFGERRNTANINIGAWDRMWHRNWRDAGADDYSFRVATSQKSIVDVDGSGLPLDNTVTPYVIDEILIGRSLGNATTNPMCDLNIWEYTDDELTGSNLGSGTNPDSLDFNGDFDPDGVLLSQDIDDLPRHARILPLVNKDGDPIKVEADGSMTKTTMGDPDTWTDSVGNPGTGSPLDGNFVEITDGSRSSFAKATTDRLGFTTTKKTLAEIANDSAYIADEIVACGVGGGEVTDPDGEQMEMLAQRGLGAPVIQEMRIPAGDAGSFFAFWGKGDPDFDGLGILPGDGLSADELQLTMRRKV